jgi:hypothetical protein
MLEKLLTVDARWQILFWGKYIFWFPLGDLLRRRFTTHHMTSHKSKKGKCCEHSNENTGDLTGGILL